MTLAELLYYAAAEPIGLLVRTSMPQEQFRQAVYRERAKLGDPALAGLQVRVWPDGLLAITNRKVLINPLSRLS